MPSYFEYMETYSVGVRTFDEAHKRLIGLANDIIAGCMEDSPTERVTRNLIELIRYTRHHFRDEEDLMRDTGFDGFEEHRLAHDALFEKVLKFTDDLIHQRLEKLAVAEFMMDWLLTHILEEDMRYKDHFARLGIR